MSVARSICHAALALPALLLWLAGCVAPAPTPKPITIEKKPVRLEYRTFPLGHPPPHAGNPFVMEGGLCETQFACNGLIGYEFPRLGFNSVTGTINKVDVTISLHIIIWTAEGTGPEVLAHEETHRAISDHYYADAERAARRAAEKVLGQKFAMTTKNKEADARDALRTMQDKMFEDFMHETHERCNAAQTQFDDLTDHGRAKITNAEAMKRALAHEEQSWATSHAH